MGLNESTHPLWGPQVRIETIQCELKDAPVAEMKMPAPATQICAAYSVFIFYVHRDWILRHPHLNQIRQRRICKKINVYVLPHQRRYYTLELFVCTWLHGKILPLWYWAQFQER